ncbi:MAG: hypothetical protein LBL06_03895 [Treponema sp.]|jgi:hypothetical protein|nr:hypothetical protein [Treponema sp.]
MTARPDYIPGQDAKFNAWLSYIVAYILIRTSGTTPEWDHIPADRVTELSTSAEKWHTAFDKIAGPHTSVDTKTKNDARKVVTACVRAFVAQYLKFAPVTDEDREAMGLHNKDTHPTRIDPPTTRPIITEIKPIGAFRVEIYFHDETTAGRSRIPYGTNGCLLNYTWGTEAVVDYDALIQSKLMTKSPFVLTLPQDAGKKIFSCAVRWQNQRGELGPSSEIKTADVWR